MILTGCAGRYCCRGYYKQEGAKAFVGRQVVCCVNLEPMHIGSVKSEVRILGSESEQGVGFIAAHRAGKKTAIGYSDEKIMIMFHLEDAVAGIIPMMGEGEKIEC